MDGEIQKVKIKIGVPREKPVITLEFDTNHILTSLKGTLENLLNAEIEVEGEKREGEGKEEEEEGG